MSRATETVAPPTLSCHPERSEGEASLCQASQTLRYAQGDKRRHAAWRPLRSHSRATAIGGWGSSPSPTHIIHPVVLPQSYRNTYAIVV